MKNYNKLPTWDKSITILIVEDDELLRDVCEMALNDLGLTVFSVVNGYDALDKIDKYVYDLILMDIMMPGIDGVEVSKEIRKRGITTPIVAMTGNSDYEDRQLYKSAGINDHLAKPIFPALLHSILIKYLGSPEEYINYIKPDTKLSFLNKIKLIDYEDAETFFTTNEPEENYLRKLIAFKKEYSTFEKNLLIEFEKENSDYCVAAMHNLKNITGLIGASKISDEAKNLQIMFVRKDFKDDTKKILDRTLYLLNDLLQDLRNYLPHYEDKRTLDLTAVIETLYFLIDENDYSVYEYLEEHDDVLLKEFGPGFLKEIKKAVDRYDYELAMKLIKTII